MIPTLVTLAFSRTRARTARGQRGLDLTNHRAGPHFSSLFPILVRIVGQLCRAIDHFCCYFISHFPLHRTRHHLHFVHTIGQRQQKQPSRWQLQLLYPKVLDLVGPHENGRTEPSHQRSLASFQQHFLSGRFFSARFPSAASLADRNIFRSKAGRYCNVLVAIVAVSNARGAVSG